MEVPQVYIGGSSNRGPFANLELQSTASFAGLHSYAHIENPH